MPVGCSLRVVCLRSLIASLCFPFGGGFVLRSPGSGTCCTTTAVVAGSTAIWQRLDRSPSQTLPRLTALWCEVLGGKKWDAHRCCIHWHRGWFLTCDPLSFLSVPFVCLLISYFLLLYWFAFLLSRWAWALRQRPLRTTLSCTS